MTTTILQPKTNVNILNASIDVANEDQKILFVGQKTAEGSAVAGELVINIANGGAEDDLFGRKSMLAAMIRANKVRNQQVQVDAISLDDNGTVFNVQNMTLSPEFPEVEAGTITVIVGSEKNHKFVVPVGVNDTVNTIAFNIANAVNADLNVPVTAVSTLANVVMTAVNAGTYGNGVGLEVRINDLVGFGVLTGTLTVGADDPVLTNVFDVIGDTRYQAIVWPYPDELDILTGLLDPRFNADGTILDGVGFTAKTGSFGNLKNLGLASNSQSLVIFGDKFEFEQRYEGSAIVEIPIVKASQFAGFRALRLDSDGFNVSDLVITTNGPLDSFGGPALASKPYFNTPFADLLPIQSGRGFTDTEIEDLKDSGITVMGNNVANNNIITGEVITTYQNDVAGNPDTTFKFLNVVDTATQAREFRFNNYRARFSQSRLTNGDIIKGHDMINELVVRSFSKRLFQTLSGPGFVLFESGEDALTFFNDNLIIDIDKALGKVTIQSIDPIVTQLRNLAVTSKIAFSIN